MQPDYIGTSNSKLDWVPPQLTVYGAVEEITAQTQKTVGIGDGIVLIMPNSPPADLMPYSG